MFVNPQSKKRQHRKRQIKLEKQEKKNTQLRGFFDDVSTFRDVQAIQKLTKYQQTAGHGREGGRKYLPDVLVPHPANLLNVGSRLGDVLERVARQDNLVLDVGRCLDSNTGQQGDTTNNLLAQEVSKLRLVLQDGGGEGGGRRSAA